MKITVVVPTYKRLNDLQRCLAALDTQMSLPHEVIVVVKSFDFETLSYIREWTAEQAMYRRLFCTTETNGVVQAMIQGLKVASGDVVAFTDDDSAPDSTWLLKMEHHYENPKVGGVGGRDILVNQPVASLQSTVGVLTWYGKLIGNHHVGFGPPREVDVLKGVNMSFRRHLVEFAPFLRGSGGPPEAYNEVGLCLRVKRHGYSLVYDPTITVNHYASPRVDTEQRTQFNAESVKNSAFNIQLSLLTWLPWYQKLARLAYSALIGDYGCPGFMRFLIGVVRREVRVVKSYVPAQVGCITAVIHYFRWIHRIGSSCLKVSSETRTERQKTAEEV